MIAFGLTTSLFRATRLGVRDLARVAESGFELVEFTAAPGHFDLGDLRHARELMTAASSAGLAVSGISVPIDAAASAVPVVRDLGCPLLIVRAGACAARPGVASPALDAAGLRRAANAIVGALTEPGPSVALDIGSPVFAPEAIVDFIESVEDAPLGLCLDVGHAHLGAGAAETAEAFSGLVLTAHLHDNNGREDSHRVPGGGTIDWPGALMACWKTGYSGPWLFDIDAGGDVTAVIERAIGARRRLQAILEDLAQPIAFTE